MRVSAVERVALRVGPMLVAVAAISACGSTARCDRRVDAAHTQALRDAPTCDFAPEALAEPECSRLDRAPLLTYYAVFCSTAALDCIRGDEAAALVCFGGPEDTGSLLLP